MVSHFVPMVTGAKSAKTTKTILHEQVLTLLNDLYRPMRIAPRAFLRHQQPVLRTQ
jgi:hypothetical protein